MEGKIKINSNWIGKGSGSTVNVDRVGEDARGAIVVYHVVSQSDGSAPEPNQWTQVTMPMSVFINSFTHFID